MTTNPSAVTPGKRAAAPPPGSLPCVEHVFASPAVLAAADGQHSGARVGGVAAKGNGGQDARKQRHKP
jgi:hypothetical protein